MGLAVPTQVWTNRRDLEAERCYLTHAPLIQIHDLANFIYIYKDREREREFWNLKNSFIAALIDCFKTQVLTSQNK